MITKDDLKEFVVISSGAKHDQEVSIVRKNWITGDAKYFKYPPYTTHKRCATAALENETPNQNWKQFEVTDMIGHADTYRQATNCVNASIDNTDVGSEYEIMPNNKSSDEGSDESCRGNGKESDNDSDAGLFTKTVPTKRKRFAQNKTSALKRPRPSLSVATNGIHSPCIKSPFIPLQRDELPTELVKPKATITRANRCNTCEETKKKIEALAVFMKERFDQLETILKHKNTVSGPEENSCPTIIQYLSLPVGCDDLGLLEENLMNDAMYKAQFISYLDRLATSSIENSIKIIMNCVYKKNVGAYYNWEGKKGKREFKNFNAIKIITGYLYEKFPMAHYKETIIKGIQKWLTSAGDSVKRSMEPKSVIIHLNTVSDTAEVTGDSVNKELTERDVIIHLNQSSQGNTFLE